MKLKVHRVGTVTLGIMLVMFGLLFLAHMVISFPYEFIFKLWPVMIIGLGVEILLANAKSDKITFVYDKGAVFLMIIICFFSMSMATMEVLFHMCSISIK